MIFSWSIFDPSSWYSSKFVSFVEFLISTIKRLFNDFFDWFTNLPQVFVGLYDALPSVIRPFVVSMLSVCIVFFLWFAVSKIIDLF